MSTTEIILVVFLGIIFIFFLVTFILLIKTKKEEKDNSSEIARLEGKISELPELVVNKVNVSLTENEIKRLEKENEKANEMQKVLDEKLNKILKEGNETLKEGSEHTNKMMKNLAVEIENIKTSSQSIATTGTNVDKLIQIIEGNNQRRGQFGEFLLNSVLQTVFGPEPSKFYETQCVLPNNMRADAVINLPLKEDIVVAIDAKFPFSDFNNIYEEDGSINEKREKEFIRQVKKHIDDVGNKYVIHDKTLNYAILYFPSDEIFYFLSSRHYDDVFPYAQKKKVVLTSANTLLPTLQTLLALLVDYERNEKFVQVIDGLNKLGDDFMRLRERWTKFGRNLDTIIKTKEELDITVNKISGRFEDISKVKP